MTFDGRQQKTKGDNDGRHDLGFEDANSLLEGLAGHARDQHLPPHEIYNTNALLLLMIKWCSNFGCPNAIDQYIYGDDEGLAGHARDQHLPPEREFFIDNLLVRIHFIIVMIRWTGLLQGYLAHKKHPPPLGPP